MNDIEKLKVIEAVVCDYLKVNSKALHTRNRARELTEARYAIMYNTRKYTRLTLDVIAAYFGYTHHVTVWHGLRVMEELIDYNGWKPKQAAIRLLIAGKLSDSVKEVWLEEFSDHVANFMITEQ